MVRVWRARRGGESGQALALALMVLVLTSFACLLLATDLSLKQREALEGVARARLRTLVDAGVAEAAASLAATPTYSGGRRELAEGTVAVEVAAAGAGRRRVEVTATWMGHTAAAEAEIQTGPAGTRVLHFRRMAPQAPR